MTISPDPQATSPEPLAVRFDEHSFWVDLADGRTLGIPLAWFPRLLHGSPEARAKVGLSRVASIGTNSTKTFPSLA